MYLIYFEGAYKKNVSELNCIIKTVTDTRFTEYLQILYLNEYTGFQLNFRLMSCKTSRKFTLLQ